MRVKPVPHAFRAFFRQIGLDPDVQRIPSERAAVSRLLHGGFRSVDVISDACLVALVETGVPVWALDADVVDDAGLGIRTATPATPRPRRGPVAGPGAASSSPTAPRARRPVCRSAARTAARGRGRAGSSLFAVGVDGVPDIHLEEALWLAADLLGAPS